MIDPFPGLVGFVIFYSPISEPPYPPGCQALTARCRGWFGGSDAVYLRATAGTFLTISHDLANRPLTYVGPNDIRQLMAINRRPP
jgi:hypothetical protein